MTRFTRRELYALGEACGFRLSGDTDDLEDAHIEALERAHQKVSDRLAQLDHMEQRRQANERSKNL